MKQDVTTMDEALRIFKALSDPTRLKIVRFLLNGEKCVCEIIPYVERAQPTVSLQLSKLENLGVVKSRRDGKSVYYELNNERVREILELVGISAYTTDNARGG